MLIRNMLKKDIPQLAILYRQFWGEISSAVKMEKQFTELEKKNTHIFLCAVEGDCLIGSVMGIICEELYGDCRPFLVIENMIVDKNYRKQGVGKALLTELEKTAKKRNCTQMLLVTESNRDDACKFYESYGFPLNNKGYKKKIV